MISIHKNKRSTESNGLRKLLSQTDVQVIGNSLFTKSTSQEGKEMRMRTKREGKFLINN